MSGGGLDDGFSLLGTATLGYSPANFGDAEETRPIGASLESLGGHRDAIGGIVGQSLTRHLGEALPVQSSPAMGSSGPSSNSWRKRLREMMLRQNETVISFLYRPATEHQQIGPVESALRRYALREDIDTHALKTLKTLMTDCSGTPTPQEEIAKLLESKGPGDLDSIRAQFQALVDLYKETGEKILDLENQLKAKLEKLDKLQKRVCTVIELQTNEATPDLVKSLENYMKISFRDSHIETLYKQLILLYKKHYSLREAIGVFRVANYQTSEPTCAICITEPVASAIVPCGHTFCSTCVKRMSLECGICRTKIRERIKLYFS